MLKLGSPGLHMKCSAGSVGGSGLNTKLDQGYFDPDVLRWGQIHRMILHATFTLSESRWDQRVLLFVFGETLQLVRMQCLGEVAHGALDPAPCFKSFSVCYY